MSHFHILLIDDDEDEFINLRDLFEEIPRSKYTITWKASYEDGLTALKSQSFDVCLLDYRLGELTGIDLLNETQRIDSICPIILLTGHGDFDLDIQAMQLGASEFLIKSELTSALIERSVRYAIKHAHDLQELKESKAQILQQDRLASLGLLASSLAHEIGTPMGIIRSRAELVEKRSLNDASLQQDMATIIRQIDRISKLVNSLLNLAREKKADHASAVDLNLAVDDVLNLIRHELDRKSISLELEIEENLLVKAEAGPLAQVLLNLIVNSIHAIEEAKQAADYYNDEDRRQHKITIRARHFTDSAEISIQDSGCGIPTENLSQLFKPFFTTKDIGHGTGLGLATSYKLVQSWNGSIVANSTVGIGTIFTVKLLRAPS